LIKINLVYLFPFKFQLTNQQISALTIELHRKL